MQMKCEVCQRPIKTKTILCPACRRSYNEVTRHDLTFGALIIWAARRARRFALGAKSELQPKGGAE